MEPGGGVRERRARDREEGRLDWSGAGGDRAAAEAEAEEGGGVVRVAGAMGADIWIRGLFIGHRAFAGGVGDRGGG